MEKLFPVVVNLQALFLNSSQNSCGQENPPAGACPPPVAELFRIANLIILPQSIRPLAHRTEPLMESDFE